MHEHEQRQMQARTTIVVSDTGTPAELRRCLTDITASVPRELDVAVVTVREIQLPARLTRRVRLVRAHSPAQGSAELAAEAAAERLVVTTTPGLRFDQGWIEALWERTAFDPEVTAELRSAGGTLTVFPATVTDRISTVHPWFTLAGVSSRHGRDPVLPAVTISAVMIVKNEQELLPSCLVALAPFVDEVVVYDTGSDDDTVRVARESGAVVVEGYWNDHFADARNRALASATGEWVLQVDADEVVTGDAVELRALLAREDCGRLHVPVVSSRWDGDREGMRTRPIRLFRRDRYAWSGALHEHPRVVDGQIDLGISPVVAPLRLLHCGYQADRITVRDKQQRNLDLSTRELAGATADDPMRAAMVSNHARSLLFNGRVDDALVAMEELRTSVGDPTAIVGAGRAGVEALVGTGRCSEALAWIDVLRANGESPGNLAVLTARVHEQQGDPEAAARELAPFLAAGTGGVDPWGTAFDHAAAVHLTARLAHARGDVGEAADLLLAGAVSAPASIDVLLLLDAFRAAGRPLAQITTRVDDVLLDRSLREVSRSTPQAAMEWFDVLREQRPDDHRPVVAGCVVAAHTDWATALAWTTHARALGLVGVCALSNLAENVAARRFDRCMAWALLAEVFGDAEAATRFEESTVGLRPADVDALVQTLAGLGITAGEAVPA